MLFVIVCKRTIVVRSGYKSCFDNLCVFDHRAKQRAYLVWSRSRVQTDFDEYIEARRHTHRL